MVFKKHPRTDRQYYKLISATSNCICRLTGKRCVKCTLANHKPEDKWKWHITKKWLYNNKWHRPSGGSHVVTSEYKVNNSSLFHSNVWSLSFSDKCTSTLPLPWGHVKSPACHLQTVALVDKVASTVVAHKRWHQMTETSLKTLSSCITANRKAEVSENLHRRRSFPKALGLAT